MNVRPIQAQNEALVAFAGGTGHPLGNVWVITAKDSGFYLNPLDAPDTFHLSAHGPRRDREDGHRFHVKLGDRSRGEVRRQQVGVTTDGYFLAHDLPRKGERLSGRRVAPEAWLVARIRWVWDMQRPRYRQAAGRGSWPVLGTGQSGYMMRLPLQENEAADADIVISYDRPFWPHEEGARREEAQLGPLRGASGMWLTVTTYRRSQMTYPAPDRVLAGRPVTDETPQRIMGGSPGEGDSSGIYWLTESITSRELLDLNVGEGDLREGLIGRRW